jgi:hypothetical protein
MMETSERQWPHQEPGCASIGWSSERPRSGWSSRASLGQAGRYFGAALDPGDFDEKTYMELATEQLGSVTPENQMKWAIVEARQGEFNWDGADKLVAFAKSSGQKIRGHNLVWRSQLPAWRMRNAFGKPISPNSQPPERKTQNSGAPDVQTPSRIVLLNNSPPIA